MFQIKIAKPIIVYFHLSFLDYSAIEPIMKQCSRQIKAIVALTLLTIFVESDVQVTAKGSRHVQSDVMKNTHHQHTDESAA